MRRMMTAGMGRGQLSALTAEFPKPGRAVRKTSGIVILKVEGERRRRREKERDDEVDLSDQHGKRPIG